MGDEKTVRVDLPDTKNYMAQSATILHEGTISLNDAMGASIVVLSPEQAFAIVTGWMNAAAVFGFTRHKAGKLWSFRPWAGISIIKLPK
jgi:hypothetical protein